MQDAIDPAAARDFYADLPVHHDFEALADRSAYRPVPDDWHVGAADIVGSTRHIEAGRYKAVNMVGAAVISAQINAAAGERFPYVFGGDGATFAFPGIHLERVRDALARVLRWADTDFGFEMRGAIVPLADIRAAGLDVCVARYATSKNVDYAMFDGGGVAWAEREMKAGHYRVQPAPVGAFPNLDGLSCRWTPMRSKNGRILSVIVLPQAGAEPGAVAGVMRRVVDATGGLARHGHPVPERGPTVRWPPAGLDAEARASHGERPLFLRRLWLLGETLFGWSIFRFRYRVGSFEPTHYVETVVENADFRKFEDGLKMTLDSDAPTRRAIEEILVEASKAGLVDYGLFEQDDALMTCIVPSLTSDDHVHFVDGAAGGYTSAAVAIKHHAPHIEGHQQ